MFKSTFCFSISLLLSQLLFSATPQLQWLGSWNRGAYFQVAHTDGQLLVAIYDSGLDILRTNIQGSIERLGSYELGKDKPSGVVADTKSAYVLTDENLLIFDIRNPQSPVLISEFPVEAVHAFLDQSMLYLFGSSITRLDISQPESPKLLFENPTTHGIRWGFLLDDRLVTISSINDIEIFKVEADGSLDPVLQNEPGEFRVRGAIAFQGNRLYAANGGITAYEISPESRVSQVGRFETNLLTRDMAVFDSTLVHAGIHPDFEGLEIIGLGDGETPFGENFRIPVGDFSALQAVDQKRFYGLSAKRGIEEFQPEASFAKRASFSPGRQATDIAFHDPYVFLATPGQLEVLSFADPANPAITATYPGLPEESQKILFRDGMLHLASPQSYQRYQVAADGALSLELQQDLGLEFVPTFLFQQPIMKAIQIQKERVLLAINRTLVTIQSDGIVETPLVQTDFGVFSQNDQVILEPPFVIARDDHILDVYEIDAEGVPNLLATQRLTQSEGPVPHPTTFHDTFLLAGAQNFDIRNKERFREYPKTETNLEGAICEDGFVYGVGPKGLQIWDFERPQTPRLVWELPEITGEALYMDGDAVITFGNSPNLIHYFNREGAAQISFLPAIQTIFQGQAELQFVNSGDSPATIMLRGVDFQTTQVQRELTVAPQATLTYPTDLLFTPPTSFKLLIEAPRAVKTTYFRHEKIVNDEPVSAAMASPVSLEALSNQVILNIPSADVENEIFVSSTNFQPELFLKLQLFDESGLVAERESFLFEGVGISLIPSFFFDQISPGQALVLVATAPEGERIAGLVTTRPRGGPEAMSRSFSSSSKAKSPVRTETLGTLGFSDTYSQRHVFKNDLLLAGGSGVLIANQSDTLNRIPTKNGSRDAAMDDTRLWVLTDEMLEVRQRTNGQLLNQMPNPSNANRIYRSGDYLFLWNTQFVAIDVIQTNDQNDLIAKERISTKGLIPRALLLLKEQLFVSTGQTLLTYSFSDTGQAAVIDSLTDIPFAINMRTDGDVLYIYNPGAVMTLQPQPGAAPIRLTTDSPEGNLLYVDQGLGLTFDRGEDRFSILNLREGTTVQSNTVEVVGSINDGRFSGNRLWLMNFQNEVFEFDIANPAAPVFEGMIGDNTEFTHLARTNHRIFSNNASGGQHMLHELQLGVDGISSEVWDMGVGTPTDIAAAGDFLYLADSEQGLIIVKLDGENGPARVGGVEGRFSHVDVNDNLLVTFEDGYHIRVYSLEDPANPVFQSETFTENDQAIATELEGNLLLIAEPFFGLSILDLSNPQAPQAIGSIATARLRINGTTLDMAIHNQHAYLADRLDLSVIDFSDPTNPVLVKRFPFVSSQVEVQGGYLFSRGVFGSSVSDRFVFDLTNPQEPVMVGSLPRIGTSDSLLDGQTLWTTTGVTVRASSFQPVRATIPWVVQNSRFQTQIQVSNTSDQPQMVTLRAMSTTGTTQSTQLQLLPFSQQEVMSTALFPELSGYALAVESASPQIHASFSTIALDGGKKAQAQALANPSTALRDGLVLNFPEQPSTAALALHAPFNQSGVEVTLRLFGSEGPLGDTTIQLQEKQPMVYLLNRLFPQATPGGSYMVTATTKDSELIDGCTFIFDKDGRPATLEGSPQSALSLSSAQGPE